MGKHIQALYYFEKAQSIYSMLLGDSDSKSLECSKDIGLALVNTNQHRQALENFRYLLIIHQRMYAPSHIEIFHDQKQIGLCHLALKNYKDSLFSLEKAFKIA